MSTARIRSAARPGPTRRAPPMPSFETLDETHRMIVQCWTIWRAWLPAEAARPGSRSRPAGTPWSAPSSTPRRGAPRSRRDLCLSQLLQGGDPSLLAHVNRLQQDHNWIEEDWLELEPHLQAVAQGYVGEHGNSCATPCRSSPRSTTSTSRWKKTRLPRSAAPPGRTGHGLGGLNTTKPGHDVAGCMALRAPRSFSAPFPWAS
jgi:hypothetical protein